MKNFITRLFIIFTIFLLLIVYCNCKNISVEIQKYADKGEIIDNIFKPEKLLGKGSFANVWRGYIDLKKIDGLKQKGNNKNKDKSKTHTEHRHWKPIALKVMQKRKVFEREQRLFTRLLANKNETVEKYGIPAIWYEGAFMKEYHAIGMTLCDASILDKDRATKEVLNPIDLLVIFYQALRSLKYIHGKEIIHQDIKADNLMVKGAQLFLIDFNAADWIYDRYYETGGNYRYRSLAYYADDVKGYYMDDLKSLYYLMMTLSGVFLPWHELDSAEDEAERLELKLQYDVVRDLCLQIKANYLRNLLIDYHDQVMINVKFIEDIKDDKRIFDYDAMGKKILNHIENLTGFRIPLFTWLSEEEEENGIWNYLPIESVSGPTAIVSGKKRSSNILKYNNNNNNNKCSVQ